MSPHCSLLYEVDMRLPVRACTGSASLLVMYTCSHGFGRIQPPCSIAVLHTLAMRLQVATDTRLWLKSELLGIRQHLADLLKAAIARAEAEVGVVMPGFTHLQPAQTVRWSHWLLSHAAAWQRDMQRLTDLLPRVSMLPLGSGGLADSVLPGRRQLTARDCTSDQSMPACCAVRFEHPGQPGCSLAGNIQQEHAIDSTLSII